MLDFESHLAHRLTEDRFYFALIERQLWESYVRSLSIVLHPKKTLRTAGGQRVSGSAGPGERLVR